MPFTVEPQLICRTESGDWYIFMAQGAFDLNSKEKI